MMAARELSPRRQQMLEVAFPCGRILSGPQSLRLRRVQHGLNPPPQTSGRLGRPLPVRLEHRQHVLDGDLVDALAAQGRRVLPKSHFPLGCMLRIRPTPLMGGDVFVS